MLLVVEDVEVVLLVVELVEVVLLVVELVVEADAPIVVVVVARATVVEVVVVAVTAFVVVDSHSALTEGANPMPPAMPVALAQPTSVLMIDVPNAPRKGQPPQTRDLRMQI